MILVQKPIFLQNFNVFNNSLYQFTNKQKKNKLEAKTKNITSPNEKETQWPKTLKRFQ